MGSSKVSKEQIFKMIELYAESFESVLYETDSKFLKGMENRNLAGDDINRYKFWEWTQGVGLFGFWKLYRYTNNDRYLKVLLQYYDRQVKIGLPAKNVNTTTPLLAMSFVAEDQKREDYLDVCKDWADWMVRCFPRTKGGGFQHLTSDTVNDQELWDDTLFMAVLFLANMGRILKSQDYIEEAKYQFLIHIKYLADNQTGLWFHGWTFDGNHNFSKALWGRGNCWVTAAIPEFLNMIACETSVKRYLTQTLVSQAEALKRYQSEDGMWHTLVDQPDSYLEASATCGFAYGILKGIHMGILDPTYKVCAQNAVEPILALTDEKGILHQVSYGTPMGRSDKEFYKKIELKPMLYGQALAILFLLEVMKEEDIVCWAIIREL